MKKKEIRDLAKLRYEAGGQAAVYDYINSLTEKELKNNGIRWKECNGCECSSPVMGTECLVCGAFVA